MHLNDDQVAIQGNLRGPRGIPLRQLIVWGDGRAGRGTTSPTGRPSPSGGRGSVRSQAATSFHSAGRADTPGVDGEVGLHRLAREERASDRLPPRATE
ncbi:hypothetical protein ACIBVL_36455 [Streptomyces sp. NPDC049687]|uniref:hypothetical protein n=1 Tax=Streptomyces sp. NPDC049687 TaxID=3365596 RepID=UPI003791C4CC